MRRFVLLSLLFLALGFYELSGGSDFDPETTRAEVVEARLARERARIAALPMDQRSSAMERLADASETAGQDAPDTNALPDVTLDLASFDAAADARNPAETPLYTSGNESEGLLDAYKLDVPETSVPASIRSGVSGTQSEVDNVVFPGRTLTSTFSYSGDEAETVATRDVRQGGADIRSVTGTLVNMRAGPGTDYDVVDQLEQATRVEVLTDDGDGWVELRALESGSTGWIAAFLLSGG